MARLKLNDEGNSGKPTFMGQAQDAAMVAIRALTDPVKIALLKAPRACNDRLLKVVYWLDPVNQAGQAPEAILDASLDQQPRWDIVKEICILPIVWDFSRL